jgi:hypothetical protein
MKTLILNSSNIVPGTNNSVLQYSFPAGSISLAPGQKVALASLQMYYSSFNITAAYGNNVFNYIWVDGLSYTVLFPDGFYDVISLNNYLHYVMLQNNHYLLSGGNYVYLITLTANANLYAIQFNNFPISVGIATTNTWTLPANATWALPVNPIVPMIQILNNAFKNIVGFNPGYYPQGAPTLARAPITGVSPNQTQAPAYATVQTYTSAFVPQVTPISSFVLSCSLINNNYAIPNNLLYSFTPQGTFGEQFTIAPYQLVFIDAQQGQKDKFTVTFTDQNNLPVAIQDPTIVIMIIITDIGDVLSLSK